MKREKSFWAIESPSIHETNWRPLAHVALRDVKQRATIVDVLRSEGWAVVDSPSGYHLLQCLAGPLFREQPWQEPELLVVDAFSPGCSGIMIANDLKDLEMSVPVVLVVNSEEHHRYLEDDLESHLHVVDRSRAQFAVLDIARKHSREMAFEPMNSYEEHRENDATDDEASDLQSTLLLPDERALL